MDRSRRRRLTVYAAVAVVTAVATATLAALLTAAPPGSAPVGPTQPQGAPGP